MRKTLVAVTGALVLAPAAQAATVGTDKPCYRSGETIRVGGSGFTPGATYTANVNGQQLPNGTGTVSPAGGFSGSFGAPSLQTPVERSFTFGASDGTNSALATYKVTPFGVVFSPNSGDPRKLRVTYRGFGFGPNKRVYLHYVKGGKLKTTVSLAVTQGDCGSLSVKKRLFPFRASRGTWTFQYDTSKKYSRSTPDAFRDSVLVRRIFR
ncbi:MAG: hypothetical protein H0T15_00190 [Thermoleophilaceae bacterium]|nr:hypothetical protein [Thermoleophilaceae bacterium]